MPEVSSVEDIVRSSPKIRAGCTRWRGQGVIVSDNFARLQKRAIGDRVDLTTPSGLLSLPIAGIITDWSDQQGSVFLDRAVYKKYWKDDTVNVVRVYVSEGTDPHSVRQRILERLSPKYPRLLVF